MAGATYTQDGTLRQLDKPPQADEVVTEADAQEPAKLTRLLGRLLRDVARLSRAWSPRVINYQDTLVAASTKYRFAHQFGTRVNWWVIDWKPTSTAANMNVELFRDSTTDENVLVLLTGAATVGTVSIRVEEAG